MVPDRMVMPYLLALKDCIAATLEKCSRPVCRVDVLAADADQLDGCDCCDDPGVDGRAWIRVDRMVSSGQAMPGCPPPLRAEVHVGISRCATLTEEGKLASTDALMHDAHKVYSDAQALYSAVVACKRKAVATTWTPQGPEGGCIGGYWTVEVPVG